METLIDKIAKTSLIHSATQMKKNRVLLKGFVLRQPLFKKGIVAFEIYEIQLTQRGVRYQNYKCFSQAKNVIESLQGQTKVVYVYGKGCLRQLKRGNAIPMITEMDILIETPYYFTKRRTK